MQNLKRNWLVVSKLTWGIWRIFTPVLKSLKNLHFNGLLWTKFIMFELKKYRGVMFHDIKDWSKISRKIDLRFGKWHEEFGKFLSEHLKVSNWDIDGIPLSKVENVRVWNLQRSYVSWQWKIVQNLKRNWLSVSKLAWGIWRIVTQVSKMCTSILRSDHVTNHVFFTWMFFTPLWRTIKNSGPEGSGREDRL